MGAIMVKKYLKEKVRKLHKEEHLGGLNCRLHSYLLKDVR